jgi:hypothetical protein
MNRSTNIHITTIQKETEQPLRHTHCNTMQCQLNTELTIDESYLQTHKCIPRATRQFQLS